VVYIVCDFGPVDQQYIDGYPSVFVFASVPGRTSTASGTFYHDKDDNQIIGDGEPIGGLEVVLTSAVDGSRVATAKTEADGTIKFGPMPAGWYIPIFNGPWKQREPSFVVVSTDSFWSHGWEDRLVPGPAGQLPDTKPNVPMPAKKVENKALAKTGADVTGLVIGGFAVLIVGVGAVLFTRKRRRQI
jgi:LPXTG-motif cell wall-anchored protein